MIVFASWPTIRFLPENTGDVVAAEGEGDALLPFGDGRARGTERRRPTESRQRDLLWMNGSIISAMVHECTKYPKIAALNSKTGHWY